MNAIIPAPPKHHHHHVEQSSNHKSLFTETHMHIILVAANPNPTHMWSSWNAKVLRTYSTKYGTFVRHDANLYFFCQLRPPPPVRVSCWLQRTCPRYCRLRLKLISKGLFSASTCSLFSHVFSLSLQRITCTQPRYEIQIVTFRRGLRLALEFLVLMLKSPPSLLPWSWSPVPLWCGVGWFGFGLSWWMLTKSIGNECSRRKEAGHGMPLLWCGGVGLASASVGEVVVVAAAAAVVVSS